MRRSYAWANSASYYRRPDIATVMPEPTAYFVPTDPYVRHRLHRYQMDMMSRPLSPPNNRYPPTRPLGENKTTRRNRDGGLEHRAWISRAPPPEEKPNKRLLNGHASGAATTTMPQDLYSKLPSHRHHSKSHHTHTNNISHLGLNQPDGSMLSSTKYPYRNQSAAENGGTGGGGGGWSVLTPEPQQNSSSRVSPPANLGLLKEINRRAQIAERTLLFLKLLGWAHLLIAICLIALDWAKLLLLWDHIRDSATKVFMMFRVVYAVYVLVLGAICVAAGTANRKGITQMLLIACLAVLTTMCCTPSNTPFAQSILEAITLSDASSHSGGAGGGVSRFYFTAPLQQRSTFGTAQNSTLDANSFVRSTATNNVIVANPIRAAQHILYSYAAFVGAQFVATAVTLYVTAMLLRVQ